jgi:hypothetical protein
MMHTLLSLLSGAVMVVLVYGLSFFPSATLTRIDEVEGAMSQADQEEANPLAEESEPASGAPLRAAGGDKDPS